MNKLILFLEQQWLSSAQPFFLSFLFCLLALVWFNKRRHRIKYNLPPSPPQLPIIGNLHQLRDPLHHTLRYLAQKYGSVMLLHFGRVPTVVVSSAEMAKEVLQTHDHVFAGRPSSFITDRLFYRKDMVFAPYDEYWRQVRKVCVVQLLSAKKVHSFQGVREEETAYMIEKIKESSSSSVSVNLYQLFKCLTHNIICRIVLGRKFGEDEEAGRKFMDLMDELGSITGRFNVGDFIPSLAWVNKFNGLNTKVEKYFHKLDSFLDEVVEEHIHKKKKVGGVESEEEDFVNVLLQMEKENTHGIPFARDNVKAMVWDMLSAGTDTTSVAIEWAMSELIKHPEIMNEVQDEVRRIARGKPFLTKDDGIDSMHYLKSVIKETLRLHHSVPLFGPHQTLEKSKIRGYDIPSKATVIINGYAIGRDPMSWEEPEKFWPKRFMSGRASLLDFKGKHFEFIPFGAGRRGCPGLDFSVAIIELALANLLNTFDWKFPNGMEVNNLDMAERSGFVCYKKNNLIVTAVPY